MTEERKVLLVIYLEDNSIDYEYNQDNEEVIVNNSLLIHGILGKVQKELIEISSLEGKEETKTDNEELN